MLKRAPATHLTCATVTRFFAQHFCGYCQLRSRWNGFWPIKSSKLQMAGKWPLKWYNASSFSTAFTESFHPGKVQLMWCLKSTVHWVRLWNAQWVWRRAQQCGLWVTRCVCCEQVTLSTALVLVFALRLLQSLLWLPCAVRDSSSPVPALPHISPSSLSSPSHPKAENEEDDRIILGSGQCRKMAITAKSRSDEFQAWLYSYLTFKFWSSQGAKPFCVFTFWELLQYGSFEMYFPPFFSSQRIIWPYISIFKVLTENSYRLVNSVTIWQKCNHFSPTTGVCRRFLILSLVFMWQNLLLGKPMPF